MVEDLLQQVEGILNLKSSLPQLPGKDFNIFTALDMETKEVNTHCRLLYELLCPNGSHGFGDAFLREFFDLVLQKPFPRSPTVYREYDISQSEEYGRIDLLIEGVDVCYPIEVKIYAGDQYRQIERYSVFATKAKEKQVYYLTLDGHEPSMESTGGKASAICLSFSTDIRKWLIRCGEIAWSTPAVTEIVRQYVCLIDKLTGFAQEDQFMDMIQKVVSASKESYESASAVEQALKLVKVEMMQKVFCEIEKHMENRAELFIPQKSYMDDSLPYYQSRKRVWPALSYLVAQHGNYKLALRFEVETNLYYGLVFFKNDWDQVPTERDYIKDAFSNAAWKEMISKKSGSDWWLWWRYLPSSDCLLDFRNCTGLYSDLFDKKRHKEIMQEIFAEIDANLDSILQTGLRKG